MKPINIAYLTHDDGLRLSRRGTNNYEQERTYHLSSPYRGESDIEMQSLLTGSGVLSTAVGAVEGDDYLSTFKGLGFDATLAKMGYAVARPRPDGDATFIRNNGQQNAGAYRQIWDLYRLDPPVAGCGRVLVCRRTYTSGASLTRLFRYFSDCDDHDARPLAGSVIGDVSRGGALQSIGYRVDGKAAPVTIGREEPSSTDHDPIRASTTTWLSLLLPAMRPWGDSMRSIDAATLTADELTAPFDPSNVDIDVTVWAKRRIYFSMIDDRGELAFESVDRNPGRDAVSYQ